MRADARADREHALRRFPERDRDDARALGHAFARPQVERHAGPAPVVDLAAERDERLGLGVRPHAGLVEIPDVLPTDHLRRLDRAQRAEDLVLLLADRSRCELGRRFHRHERQHLEEVVDDHVAVRAGLLVEPGALADRQGLGDVDLHVRDVLTVPDRFEQPVGEPERQDVERGFLPEEVVDAEDLALVERGVEHVVERHRARQVGAERLLHDDARSFGEVRLAEQRDDLGRGRGRDAQVVEAGCVTAERVLELGDDLGERLGAFRLADVEQAAREPVPLLGRHAVARRTRRARRARGRGTRRRRDRRATCRGCGTPAAVRRSTGGRGQG